MKTTFCLRNAKGRAETSLYCYVHFSHRQLKLSTGCKILPKNWNQSRRRVKSGVTGEQTINAILATMEADLAAIFSQLAATGVEPTLEIVKERYAARSGRVRAQAPPNLFEAYDAYIESSEHRPATKANHHKAKNHLKTFAETYSVRLTFDRLDRLFWERFGTYLLSVQGMATSSAWNILKTLKAFLADAIEKGHTRTDDFRKVTRATLPKGESSDKVFLTMDELRRVQDIDLTDNPRLDRVRDLFVFLSFTGIRFGDSQQLTPENIDGDVLRLTLQKNRKSIIIPLLEPARAILDRYNGTLPRITNQKANLFLAEVLQLAGIDTPVQVVSYSGTTRRESIVPKHEVVGMHTGKRTFVSLLRQKGVSIEGIMKVTGNSRATLERYVLRTDHEALEEIRDAWR